LSARWSAIWEQSLDRLGIYKTLNRIGPARVERLAESTKLDTRYLKEWLAAQAAAGYVTYDEKDETFSLSPEQAMAFAQEDSPFFMPGAFEAVSSMFADEPKISEAFRTGAGVGWHEHNERLFRGTERFFRPGYAANLVSSWLPALDGVVPKLKKGARVADVGCGHGASTLLMAKAFPKSRFVGFDYHVPSIARARQLAKEAGLSDRVTFETGTAKDFPGERYDLVAFFDCLHDMGDPVGAARHVRASLAKNGTWMIVEPFAHDHLSQNLNPVGRIFYAASTMICTPASRSQEVGCCLGAQAGETRLREVITEGGFSSARRATETPFNMVLEARP
jgi:2-polyprenyl-3-methyl-5-hydroxy-6-metoxy-1,4-benzoquinol methylase